MNNHIFIFDTYAILEIINGNKNYENYLDAIIVINHFIFAELCYKLLRENVPDADRYISDYARFVEDAKPEVIRQAMQFRILNIKKNLSMTDCISYIMAKRLNIKFLTGDKGFENMEGVEFVR